MFFCAACLQPLCDIAKGSFKIESIPLTYIPARTHNVFQVCPVVQFTWLRWLWKHFLLLSSGTAAEYYNTEYTQTICCGWKQARGMRSECTICLANANSSSAERSGEMTVWSHGDSQIPPRIAFHDAPLLYCKHRENGEHQRTIMTS